MLLKGADTIVASPREGVLVATYGTPALATAGSGDVLTGIVAAFLAKGMDARLAAGTAAVAHGVAAELLDPQPGTIASDLLPGAAARARRARPAARAAAVRSEIDDRPRRAAPQRQDAAARARRRELWAVVKANAYGHGAVDCADAALGAGAAALCTSRPSPRRSSCARSCRRARILVLGPASSREIARAREADLALVVSGDDIPEGVAVHVKLDTGMGRWGGSELPSPTREVVGVMTHLATADGDLEYRTAAARALPRGDRAVRAPDAPRREQRGGAAAARVALRRGALRDRDLRALAVRHRRRTRTGSSPCSSWTTEIALSKLLRAGESTGYGRRFVAERDTWIGILPVGYADGFRRDLTGTEVRVAGERRRVVGTISMDATAVELDRELPRGTPVTIVGPGVPLEEHAAVADTITYELACGIDAASARARRVVVDS